jgi:hypothetical protein
MESRTHPEYKTTDRVIYWAEYDKDLVRGGDIAFLRYKQIFGGHLNARCIQAQRVEAALACEILSGMGAIGMPNSVAIPG